MTDQKSNDKGNVLHAMKMGADAGAGEDTRTTAGRETGGTRGGRETGGTRRGEEGYILLGVLILLVLFVIAMAVAAPKIAYDIQRDRDVETMERGKQYIRAIQLYYRKFNAYPPSIDALVKTNDIRFLRKRYIDPITGKDDWKPIQYCQNKAPIAMGFFGQPLGPTSGCGPMLGTGPSGGNGLNGTGMPGSTMGQSPTGGPVTSPPGATPAPGGTTPGGATPGGTSGTPGSAPGGTDTSGGDNGSSSTGMFGDSMQGGGAGGIIGVSPASDKKSILVYKKKDHYNQWEFTYSPMMDMQGTTMGTGVQGGSPTGSPTTPTTGPIQNNGSTPIQPPPSSPPQ